MISSMLKLRGNPEKKTSRDYFRSFTTIEKADTEIEIRILFPDFDYDLMLSTFNTKDQLIASYDNATSYEKINIIRVIKFCVNEGIGENVLQKFIDESYHIENTATFQLDPSAYNCVPEYIISACNEYVNRHR